ncbi:MAG TPA: sucrose-phosphate phosphatase [Thermosynechococcaceae cyanobacterium]
MKPFLLITDLDNTLVGDDAALAELNHQLTHLRQHGSKLVYSTGRSRTSYQKLTTERTLLAPDLLVCAVGTEVYSGDSTTPDASWSEKLTQNWDRDLAIACASQFADLTPQADSEQRPFKVSYFLTPQAAVEVVPQLEALLHDRGLDAQVIYSGEQDLDILPRLANKGRAMTFVRQVLDFPPEATIACGDSGNDLALFVDRSEFGIIVGNAMPELLRWHQAHPNPDRRYLSQAFCAAGILEGLQHFGFL